MPPAVYSNGAGLAAASSTNNLLLRPAENSPFCRGGAGGGGSSTNSTPYSQISVPSSYSDYEDDFTSDEEAPDSEDDDAGSVVYDNKKNK